MEKGINFTKQNMKKISLPKTNLMMTKTIFKLGCRQNLEIFEFFLLINQTCEYLYAFKHNLYLSKSACFFWKIQVNQHYGNGKIKVFYFVFSLQTYFYLQIPNKNSYSIKKSIHQLKKSNQFE